jgi:hypothetical protein
MAKWEVSLIVLKENGRKKYKVIRRLPEMKIAETRVFSSRKKALEQFSSWSE